jgi:hypothetical protein
MPLKALLRDLKAAGVARYRDVKKGIEIEFGSTMTFADEHPERPEGEQAREKARPELRDPLRAAFDMRLPEDGADPDVEVQ